MDVEKTVHLNQLFDFYGPLLTERQRLLFRRYYQEDLSLGEISEEFQISRQAVYDILRRSEHTLQDLERKLGLLARHNREKARLERVEEELARLSSRVGADVVAPLQAEIANWRREWEMMPPSADEEAD